MQIARWAILFLCLCLITGVGIRDADWPLIVAGTLGALTCAVGAATDRYTGRRHQALRVELAMHQRAEQRRRGANQRRDDR